MAVFYVNIRTFGELFNCFVLEHNETIVKQEPDSDGETDPELSHHRDQVPAPFSFVAVKSEIVVSNICIISCSLMRVIYTLSMTSKNTLHFVETVFILPEL